MNKPMYKKVSKTGGFTIPRQFREECNIPKGAAIEVTKNEDGEIVIKKHIPTCVCCGTADYVTTINGIEMCSECAKKFIGGIDYGNDD